MEAPCQACLVNKNPYKPWRCTLEHKVDSCLFCKHRTDCDIERKNGVGCGEFVWECGYFHSIECVNLAHESNHAKIVRIG